MSHFQTGSGPVCLADYRERSARLRQELVDVNASRDRILRALNDVERFIAAALAPEQPLLPIAGLERADPTPIAGAASTTL